MNHPIQQNIVRNRNCRIIIAAHITDPPLPPPPLPAAVVHEDVEERDEEGEEGEHGERVAAARVARVPRSAPACRFKLEIRVRRTNRTWLIEQKS